MRKRVLPSSNISELLFIKKKNWGSIEKISQYQPKTLTTAALEPKLKDKMALITNNGYREQESGCSNKIIGSPSILGIFFYKYIYFSLLWKTRFRIILTEGLLVSTTKDKIMKFYEASST